jgi:hypothetical protein
MPASCAAPIPCPRPAYPGPCSVPCTVRGSLPTCSTTSISPQSSQPTASMFVPSVQNAGHTPRPAGTLIRASIRPYRAATRPLVMSRADVTVPVAGPPRGASTGSRRATTASRPYPSSATLAGSSVYHCSCSSPQPRHPARRSRSPDDGDVPAAPSKSSAQSSAPAVIRTVRRRTPAGERPLRPARAAAERLSWACLPRACPCETTTGAGATASHQRGPRRWLRSPPTARTTRRPRAARRIRDGRAGELARATPASLSSPASLSGG